MAQRLLPNHPDFQAVEKWFALADELKIRIEFMGTRTFLYVEGNEYDLEDLENRDYSVTTIPPSFEYKIVKDRQ